MAKNYPALYASQNPSSALEQKFYIKEETTRGVLVLPSGTDHLRHIGGASSNFSQPRESSPQKSGRHHNSVIKGKSSTSWSIPSYFHIDTSLGSLSTAEIDPALRVLNKSMYGYENTGGGSPVYSPLQDPSTTFSIFENGDTWGKQTPGAFVESKNMTFPGDGRAQQTFAGSAKTQYLVGMMKSTTNNTGGNTFTGLTGEGLQMPVGGKVMIIKANNAKSSDTPAGSARTIVSVTGDVVLLDGATLTDADGSSTPVYLVYFDPETPTAINDPQTGLVGSIAIVGFGGLTNCVRAFSINEVNNHELQNFCYGEEGLGGPLFTPGGRFTAPVSMELNLTKQLAGFFNRIKAQGNFTGENITLILGSASGRHMQTVLPKVIFNIPEIPVPDAGSIPVTFNGMAYETAEDAADEVTESYI